MASIALATERELLGEYSWQVGQSHSTTLFPCVQWLLQATGRTMTDVRAIAVAIGPGSFNGIRVAVTAAKALAFVLHVPLVGICGLDVMAYAQAASDLPVFVIQEAGRGELYTAGYRRIAASEAPTPAQSPHETWLLAPDDPAHLWVRSTGYLLTNPAELAAMAGADALLCGEMRDATRATLRRILGAHARFLPDMPNVRRASILAALAEQRLRRGQTDDPLTLEPLYLRRPAITASKKATINQLPVTNSPRPRATAGGQREH
jgi:tRNA threonylcarbamoyladenosine biosynthesis protein TsaB